MSKEYVSTRRRVWESLPFPVGIRWGAVSHRMGAPSWPGWEHSSRADGSTHLGRMGASIWCGWERPFESVRSTHLVRMGASIRVPFGGTPSAAAGSLRLLRRLTFR